MRFSLSFLRIKGLDMFRASLAHPQKVLPKRHLVYCVRIMSVGCGTVVVSLQQCHSQMTLYASIISNSVCAAYPEDEQVMLETCRGLWFTINWMKSLDVYVTVHRRQSEGKEQTKCDKVSSFIASTCFGHQYAQAASQVWPPKSWRHSLIVLLMMGILVSETCSDNTNYILCRI
jgi:hypothetical protein